MLHQDLTPVVFWQYQMLSNKSIPTHTGSKMKQILPKLNISVLFPGEWSSLEEVINQMLVHQPPLLKPPVIDSIWQTLHCNISEHSISEANLQSLRSGIALISMIAVKQPETVLKNLDTLLRVRRSNFGYLDDRDLREHIVKNGKSHEARRLVPMTELCCNFSERSCYMKKIIWSPIGKEIVPYVQIQNCYCKV